MDTTRTSAELSTFRVPRCVLQVDDHEHGPQTAPRRPDARHTSRDKEEFCEFVTARSSALFRVAYLILGDYQLAQDLVQESLAKTYVAWPGLHEVGNAEAYTRRVIATTAISWRRRRGFHERPAEHLPERGAATPPRAWSCTTRCGPPVGAATSAAGGDRAASLRGLSEAQTAETMGCSVGTVKSSVLAGLRKLRERIGPDLDLLPSDDQAVLP